MEKSMVSILIVVGETHGKKFEIKKLPTLIGFK
jgi:hypothetical protein